MSSLKESGANKIPELLPSHSGSNCEFTSDALCVFAHAGFHTLLMQQINI